MLLAAASMVFAAALDTWTVPESRLARVSTAFAVLFGFLGTAEIPADENPTLISLWTLATVFSVVGAVLLALFVRYVWNTAYAWGRRTLLGQGQLSSASYRILARPILPK